MKELIQLLKEATQIDGVSGHEQAIANWFIESIKPFVKTIKVDALGNVYAYLNEIMEGKPTLMIEGHLDEVGFIVRHIQENGLLQIKEVGGWFEQTLLAKRCTITNRSGQQFKATICSVPPHLLTAEIRNKPFPVANMIVDAGFESKQAVLKAGIQIGDMIVLDGAFEQLSESRVVTKAVDNRYSLVQMIALAKRLTNKISNYNLVFVASVQEEVGLRGASVVVNNTKADAAIVLDCSAADDLTLTKGFGQLGQGALIRVWDSNFIAHQKFIDLYVKALESVDAKYQYFISNGGTDAGNIHKSAQGIMTLTACICARNIHTPSSVVDMNDVNAVLNGLYALCLQFESKGLGEILFNYQSIC